MNGYRALLLVCLLTTCPVTDGSTISGDFVLGLRTVSVSGDRQKFAEDINLDDGVRLLDAVFEVRTPSSNALVPELLRFEAHNLGGDPFESARIEARRNGAWRLLAERRRSAWFYDDLLLRPGDASLTGATAGDLHRYDFERVRDTLELGLTLGPRTGLALAVKRNARQGDSTTAFNIQRDEFELAKPVDDLLQTYRLSMSHRWQQGSLLLEESLHDYENSASVFLPGFSVGENPSNPSTLDNYFLSQPGDWRQRNHRLRLRFRPTTGLALGFDSILGEREFTTTLSERAQGVGFNGQPFMVDATGASLVDLDLADHRFDAAYRFSDAISARARFQVATIEQRGRSAVTPGDEAVGRWDIDRQRLELGTNWQARDDLGIYVAWAREIRDVSGDTRVADDSPHETRNDNKTNNVVVALRYRPGKHLSLTLDMNDTSNSEPFSLALPRSQQRFRGRLRYRFENGVALLLRHVHDTRDNQASRWAADLRETGLRVSFARDDLTLRLGIARLTSTRAYLRHVIGGSREELFRGDYRAKTLYTDLAVRWTPSERLGFSADWRGFDNNGSFGVRRADLGLGIDRHFGDSYRIGLNLRRIEFSEDSIEAYTAKSIELRLASRF